MVEEKKSEQTEKMKCCKENNTTEKKCCQDNKLAELMDLLLRTQASYENYRKQVEKRIVEIHEMAAKDILCQILPITENFDLALKNTKHKSHQDFVEGIKLIQTQIASMLENNQVEIIPTMGKIFDPNLHEALMKVESNQPENIIIEEFSKGFTLHGKVIRHAKVKVSAGNKSVDNKKIKDNNSEE